MSYKLIIGDTYKLNVGSGNNLLVDGGVTSLIKRWNGTDWVTLLTLPFWDGATWNTTGKVKYWNGSSWVQVN